MKKSAMSLLIISILIGALQPAYADEGGMKGVFMVPVKIIAFGTGAVLGTPVAVVRKVSSNTKSAVESAGKTENPVFKGLAYLVALPVGLLKGGIEGAYWGTANAYKHSGDNPFSKDSFSLGEME
jgi:hypothetical protein